MDKLRELAKQRNELERQISELYMKLTANEEAILGVDLEASSAPIVEANKQEEEKPAGQEKEKEIDVPIIKEISYAIMDAIEDSPDTTTEPQILSHILAKSGSEVLDNTLPQSAPKCELEWREQPSQVWKNRKYNRHVISRTVSTSGEKSIQITDNISLPAITVATFDAVADDGRLYYVESANHFAMYILKHLFHGNIGNIYNNEKMPVKIKNCQFHTKEYSDRCRYYHDPMTVSGSNDVRNFVANAWTYNSMPINEYTKQRHFGSLSNLDSDIKGVSSDDIARYRDMAFHDLLCLFVLLS